MGDKKIKIDIIHAYYISKLPALPLYIFSFQVYYPYSCSLAG
jgi:hypothetical protein